MTKIQVRHVSGKLWQPGYRRKGKTVWLKVYGPESDVRAYLERQLALSQ